jgi:hypothetical protein
MIRPVLQRLNPWGPLFFGLGFIAPLIRELRNRLERAFGLVDGQSQLSASALFPEETLLVSPKNRISSLAEARDRASGCRSRRRFGRRVARSGRPPSCLACPVQLCRTRCVDLDSRDGAERLFANRDQARRLS